MPTVRINIPSIEALDGITPIPASAIVVDNKPEQLIEITLSNLDVFGFFDPGQVFGQQSADLMLTHFLLSSENPSPPGSFVGITPPNWLTTGQTFFAVRPLFVTGTGLSWDSSNGVMGEGSCLPIPVDHQLTFNTQGSRDGPYVIQMTFNPIPKIDQDWSAPPTLADLTVIPIPER